MTSDNRNLIIFIVLTLVMVIGYQQFVLGPIQKRHQAEAERAQATQAAAQKAGIPLAPNGQPVVVQMSRAQALAASPRVAVQTPSLTGSISLQGARLDDLYLAKYPQTVAPHSPPVELLRPEGAENAYFALAGWEDTQSKALVDKTTLWTAASSDPLTPEHPVELTYASPQGLIYHRQIKVDAEYLFTVTDTVENHGSVPVTLRPYGSVQRLGVPATLGKVNLVHEGAIGVFDRTLKEVKYSKWKKDADQKAGVAESDTSTGGWLGVTDKYWMTTFVPNQSEPLNTQFRVDQVGGVDDYEVAYVGAAKVLPAGGQVTEVTHLFAGAKVVQTLNHYGAALGTPNFDKAVDWGFLEVLTKPLFTYVLDFYARRLANFGLAILALTVTIRLVMFPLFNASYEMSTKMKKVQPQMKALQDKFKNDPQGLQKEMMALYAQEKINPVTGCIPMLLPIPVFYALTKIFSVTIEMRQTPFLWVKDLSSPDQTSVWNLFGALPWDPINNPISTAVMQFPFVGGIASLVLHLGAWPIIYAVTMWFSLLTGPTMTGIDPMQQRMMRWMPWVFMFVLAQSTVGLVIYWSFSSVFTVVQQYVLMRRFKVDNPIDQFLARFSAPKVAKAAE
ncbi:MAG: membrane protein insertase YidC [Caulobacterales bacterium]